MNKDVEKNIQHSIKMKKIKKARNKIMENKLQKKGLIIVHTGAGKGKSSSAFGILMSVNSLFLEMVSLGIHKIGKRIFSLL